MGWTVQKMIDDGYTLGAACHRTQCFHFGNIDLAMLKARLGPDHSTMAPDLVPKLRCTKCGGKNVGLILHPPDHGRELRAGRPNANG